MSKKSTKRKNKAINKSHHLAKIELVTRYGTRCWLCGNDVGKGIQYHHIIPKYAGGHPSDVSNGSLVCGNCHIDIHLYEYGTEDFQYYTEKILDYKNTKGE